LAGYFKDRILVGTIIGIAVLFAIYPGLSFLPVMRRRGCLLIGIRRQLTQPTEATVDVTHEKQ
jgi:hypothetical protein